MYDTTGTIVAAATSPEGPKTIIRLCGPLAFGVLGGILKSPIPNDKQGISGNSINIGGNLDIEAVIYLFPSPHSYSGEDIAELHLCAGRVVTELIIQMLTAKGARPAGPGEFTARAYLNGKIDLAQAEAVAEIVASSNKFQLAAAENLLAGRLSKTITVIREKMLEVISLLEAGMDFSQENIEFITKENAINILNEAKKELENLAYNSIKYESMINLPAIGLAGTVNSGKSSLLNRLLGQDRSIVSSESGTTRDILSGLLQLEGGECVIFDCAGLGGEDKTVVDNLARQAAIEAINSSWMVLFCVDCSRESYQQQLEVLSFIKAENKVTVVTKCDLLSESNAAIKKELLQKMFGENLIFTSSVTGAGIDALRQFLDETLNQRAGGYGRTEAITVNQRHKKSLRQAIIDLSESVTELKSGREETAVMFLRSSYEGLSTIENEDINEEILDKIFSRFCIGK